MVTHMTTKKEQAELKKTFNLFDLNGDGKIAKQEFIDSYKKVYTALDEEQVLAQASEFFERADTDKNGSIDYGEWCAATINRRNMLNEANLKGCF
jgi:calcium-dependent protein kinase